MEFNFSRPIRITGLERIEAMSALRTETAPPEDLAVAVTSSLRPDVSGKTIDFSSGPPPGDRREREPSPPKRIRVSPAAIPSPRLILSSIPL